MEQRLKNEEDGSDPGPSRALGGLRVFCARLSLCGSLLRERSDLS